MNKKELYESIMRNVAKQVKKVLNENITVNRKFTHKKLNENADSAIAKKHIKSAIKELFANEGLYNETLPIDNGLIDKNLWITGVGIYNGDIDVNYYEADNDEDFNPYDYDDIQYTDRKDFKELTADEAYMVYCVVRNQLDVDTTELERKHKPYLSNINF